MDSKGYVYPFSSIPSPSGGNRPPLTIQPPLFFPAAILSPALKLKSKLAVLNNGLASFPKISLEISLHLAKDFHIAVNGPCVFKELG